MRPALLSLLHTVHVSNDPHIIGLRLQDPIPEWITRIALVQGGHVETGERTMILDKLNSRTLKVAGATAALHTQDSNAEATTLVDTQNVNLRYHERHVRWCSSLHILEVYQVWCRC